MTYIPQNWHQGSHTNLSAEDIGRLRAMDDQLAGVGPTPFYDLSANGADLTGTTDCAPLINNLIANAPSGGATIYCPAGTYRVDSSIDLRNKANVRLVGDGSWRATFLGSNPTTGTVLKRLSGSSAMVRMGVTASASNSLDYPGQALIGMSLWANNLATTGLLCESMFAGIVDDIFITKPTTVGLDLNTIDLSGVEDTQNNWFSRVAVNATGGSATAIGVRFGSWQAGGGNVSINTFQHVHIYHKDGVAWQMGDSDSNEISAVWVNRAGGGTAIAIELKGSSVSNQGHCRHNHFSQVETAAGGLTSRGTALTQPAVANMISAYSRANSSPSPTVETGSTLYWRETSGAFNSPQTYTVTNPSTDRGLNVSGDTTAQVAAVLGTLISDLQAQGLIS